MDKLYRETKTNLLQVSDLLGKFERSVTQDELQASKSLINEKFNEITNSCNQLDIHVTKEPASRRYDTKMKVDQLKYDFQHYRTAFNTIQYKK
jgi:golgi SNAP receptor complex member 2